MLSYAQQGTSEPTNRIEEGRMRQLKISKSITNRESASLDRYLQEIGREELITIEE